MKWEWGRGYVTTLDAAFLSSVEHFGRSICRTSIAALVNAVFLSSVGNFGRSICKTTIAAFPLF